MFNSGVTLISNYGSVHNKKTYITLLKDLLISENDSSNDDCRQQWGRKLI